MKDESFAAHEAHFGPISQELMDYVTNHVLLQSRYLFIQTQNGIQSAFCTHCKKVHYPKTLLKHREYVDCPKCKSRCMVYRANVGRKYLRDFAYVVYYQKSIIDPSVVTAVGFYVQRDYTGDFRHVETAYRPSCSYVFQMGNSSMYYTGFYDPLTWYRSDNIKSEYSDYNNIRKYYSRESIAAAVAGTPLQYSAWGQYDDQDMTKYFGLYTQYPCIEYLTKMKLRYFVKAKLYGGRTYDAINWRGRTIEQVLRLKKHDIRRFMEHYPEIKYDDCALALRLYQLTLNDSDRPAVGDLENIAERIEDIWPDLKRMFKYQSVMKSVQYVEKQFKKGKGQYYRVRSDVTHIWKDYMKQCNMLELDTSRLEIVFPHDLHAAHEKATAQVKVSLSEIEKRKIATRSKALERYRFEHNGLIIRAPGSADEIINEGKALRHCVGDYAQDHADGKTNILLIRKISAPDEPYFTMEIKKGKIIQCRGYKNYLPKEDVEEFIRAFKEAKLTKKPPARQEVAV